MFARRPPQDLTLHRNLFRCKLRFNAECSALVFSPHMLGMRLVPRGRRLEPAQALTETADRMRRLLPELLLDRQCTMAEASHRLGLHRRTLNRRLEEEGTSFRTLADGARFVRAQHLMVNTDLSIGEIAFLLDYTEVSAFSHAFRRWAGVSPREWRR